MHALTLITGDVVRYTGSGSTLRVVSARPAQARRSIAFATVTDRGDRYVIPSDAWRQVATGSIDKSLFDVSLLVADRLDDAHATSVGVIITRRPHLPPAVAIPAAAHARTTRLTALGAQNVAVDKGHATAMWNAVANERHGRTDVAAGTRLWLDGTVHATLDVSVPLIGAPRAWKLGYTGKGVKVAVLDTGIDTHHPDLVGKVIAARNFSDSPTVNDRFGHGTHVASIITGTGAASGGRYRGVAPGVKLVDAKVLGDDGSGQDSSILAGMQWAVSQGAKIVNMSLGGRSSDGTDVLSAEVNALSDEDGTLFVIAAGNSGAPGTVSAPGSAQQALTVASTTKQDTLSYFSSQGPRIGNFGLKPEIAAPGSDIIAARLPGAFPESAVDKYYVRLSGTSMATPHVAGSAAILAQEHPIWNGQQLKAALMDSAKVLRGVGVFADGAGRVDVGSAVTSTVRTLTPDVGFGILSSASATPVQRQQVRYENDGPRPVTLHLGLNLTAVNGTKAQAGLVSLSRKTLVLPAHRGGSVSVTARAAGGSPGGYSGRLLASAGTSSLDTPVAVELQAPMKVLTLTVHNAAGHPVSADDTFAITQNEATGEVFYVSEDHDVLSVAVPAGRYRVVGAFFGPANPIGWTALTEFARDVRITGATKLTVNTAGSTPFRATVDRPGVLQDDIDSLFVLGSSVQGSLEASDAGFVTQAEDAFLSFPPGLRGLTYSYIGIWGRPLDLVSVDGTSLNIDDLDDNSQGGWSGDVDAPVVDVGDRVDPATLPDVRGRIVLVAPPLEGGGTNANPPSDAALTALAHALRRRGAALVLSDLYFADTTTIPILQMYSDNDVQNLRDEIAAGHDSVHVLGRPFSPTRFSLFRSATTVPAGGLDWSFPVSSLARVDETYRQPAPGGARSNDLILVDAQTTGVFATNSPAFYPATRVDYFSPGVSWSGLTGVGESGQADTNEAAEDISEPRVYRGGEHLSDSWGSVPFSPALPRLTADPQTGQPLPWAYRHGDQIFTDIAPFNSTSPTHQTLSEALVFGGNPYDSGRTALYRGNHLVDASDVPGVAGFTVPPSGAKYRLVLDATRAVPGWPLSTHVHASWTFGSQASALTPAKASLPLLTAYVNLRLGLHDDASPGRPLTGEVTVDHQQGSAQTPIQALAVSVSYDHGTTWHLAMVTRVAGRGSAGRFGVGIPAAPLGAKTVRMRISTSDTAGRQLTETIDQAYNLR